MGVTSWYQSQLPVGSPFPTPWSKLSLVVQNYFTNLAVWLMGPRRHWVVLGSFIPRLYSRTLIFRLFGLNILLSLTLGSRTHFLPESPFSPDDCLLLHKISKILSDVSPKPLCPSPLQFHITDKPLWITTYTCPSYCHPKLILLLQDAL